MADTSFNYEPDTDYNGYDTIQVIIHDLGIPNLSDTLLVYMVIVAINDAPSFTKDSNQTIDEDAGAQNVTGWATAISKGPADESSQNLTFTVTNDNNIGFFCPSIRFMHDLNSPLY